MSADLTIAIPTYDRPAELNRTLTALLPQLTAGVRLLVLDNASEVPAESVAAPLLAGFPDADVRVLRHRFNIGGDANVMRGFELAETDWLWVLGDDDLPLPGAVARALAAVAAHPDAAWVNFSSELHARPATYATRGLREFVEGMDSFGAAVFISSSLFRVPAMVPGLRWAARYSYSMVPQLAVMMAAMTPATECVFSHERLVGYAHRPEHQAWSVLNWALGVMTVADGLRAHELRVALGRRVVTHLPPIGMVLEDLVDRVAEGWCDAATAVHFLDQLCSRTYAYERGLGRAVKRRLARALVRTPLLTRFGITAYRKARGQTWAGRLEGRGQGRE